MLLLQLNSYFDQMKMGAGRLMLFADWGRIIRERDIYEVGIGGLLLWVKRVDGVMQKIASSEKFSNFTGKKCFKSYVSQEFNFAK